MWHQMNIILILPLWWLFLISEQKSTEEVDGIDTENLLVLERLKQNQRKDYLKVSTFKGNVRARYIFDAALGT